jgi:RimJ/RimL family protein N-acetyltransferase
VAITDGVVTLTAFVSEDAPVMCRADHDPEHRRWFDFPDDFVPSFQHSLDVIARWASERAAGERFPFAVRATDTGVLLGGCELRPLGNSSANLSYWTYPSHRRRGIGSRAAGLACTVAFDDFGWDRIELLAHPENIASRAVARRLGFRETDLRAGLIVHLRTRHPQPT